MGPGPAWPQTSVDAGTFDGPIQGLVAFGPEPVVPGSVWAWAYLGWPLEPWPPWGIEFVIAGSIGDPGPMWHLFADIFLEKVCSWMFFLGLPFLRATFMF